MNNSKTSIFQSFLNLKESHFFNIKPPKTFFTTILHAFHHIQLLVLLWINANIIYMGKNRSAADLINPSMPYLILIEARLGSLIEKDNISRIIVTAGGIVIYAVFLIIMLYKITTKRKIPMWISLLYSNLGYVLVFVISLPGFNILLNLAIESFRRIDDNSIYIAWIVLSLIGIAVLCSEILFFLNMNIPLKTSDPNSRFDNNFILITLIHKLTISGIYLQKISSNSLTDSHSVLLITILNLLFSVFSVLLLTWRCSFTNFSTINLLTFLQACVLTAAFSNLVGYLKSPFYDLSSTSIIFQSILFFLLIYKIMNNWVKQMITSDMTMSQPASWLNIKMINQIKENREPEARILVVDNMMKYFQSLKFITNFNPKSFLEQVSQKTDDQTKLVIAYVYLLEMNDYYNSYLITYNLLRKLTTSFPIKIGALYLQNKIEAYLKEINSNNPQRLEIDEYFLFVKNNDYLKKKISVYLESNISFFKTLGDKIPDLYRISQQSADLQKKFNETQSLWRSFSENDKRLPAQLVRIYFLFLTGVKIRPQEARIIANLYDISLFSDKKDEDSKLFDWIRNENTISVFTCVKSSSFGKILSVSNSVTKCMGYSSSDLIGKNYDSLFPKAFAEYNERILRKLIDPESNLKNIAEFPSFILHKNGYIISCNVVSMICLKSSFGLCVGTIISLNSNHSDVVLIDKKMKIAAATEKLSPFIDLGLQVNLKELDLIRSKWNKKIQEYQNDNPKLSNVMSRYKSSQGKVEEPNNLKQLSLEVFTIKMSDEEIFLIQVDFKELSEIVEPSICEEHHESADLLNVSQEVDEEFCPKYTDAGDIEARMATENYLLPTQPTQRSIKSNNLMITKQSSRNDYPSRVLANDAISEESEELQIETRRANGLKDYQDNNYETQSYLTSQSDNSLRKMDILFNNLQKKMRFYKFRHSHLLFTNFVVFILLFAITILISYLNGINAFDNVTSRIKLMVNFSERNRIVLGAMRGVWLDHIFEDYLEAYYPPATFQYFLQINALQIRRDLITLGTSNNRLKTDLSRLDDLKLTNFHLISHMILLK